MLRRDTNLCALTITASSQPASSRARRTHTAAARSASDHHSSADSASRAQAATGSLPARRPNRGLSYGHINLDEVFDMRLEPVATQPAAADAAVNANIDAAINANIDAKIDEEQSGENASADADEGSGRGASDSGDDAVIMAAMDAAVAAQEQGGGDSNGEDLGVPYSVNGGNKGGNAPAVGERTAGSADLERCAQAPGPARARHVVSQRARCRVTRRIFGSSAKTDGVGSPPAKRSKMLQDVGADL